MSSIHDNYQTVSKLVSSAARRSGRGEDAAKLLVVSKRWPAEVVQEVVDCGHQQFGESRIQEAVEKLPLLPADLDWHFIGHIQKNKARKILTLFHTLHSVDSPELARRLDAIAGELGLRPDIFLQVNIAGEESKHGFVPDDLREQIGELLELGNLNICGLMAIPPKVENPEDSRPLFRAVRELQEALASASGASFPDLSMGMSGDYEVAIEEGSTIVRVGSSIFGPRP
ncbi:MAG: YggS family pyridoxal phosphate-dependent enzyme [Verrucomicrobiales bacterium]